MPQLYSYLLFPQSASPVKDVCSTSLHICIINCIIVTYVHPTCRHRLMQHSLRAKFTRIRKQKLYQLSAETPLDTLGNTTPRILAAHHTVGKALAVIAVINGS